VQGLRSERRLPTYTFVTLVRQLRGCVAHSKETHMATPIGKVTIGSTVAVSFIVFVSLLLVNL
jgi:hypothetical protein